MKLIRFLSLGLALTFAAATYPAIAQTKPQPEKPLGSSAAAPAPFKTDDLVKTGHKFFGSLSQGLASAIEAAVSRWGQPNGYILGQ